MLRGEGGTLPRIAEVKAQGERIWLATFQRSLVETVTRQVRQHAPHRGTLAGAERGDHLGGDADASHCLAVQLSGLIVHHR